MQRRLFSFLVVLSLASFACSTRADSPKVVARELEYIERTTGGADPKSELPMIVIIHGLGARPEDIVSLLEDLPLQARLIAPRAPDPWGDGSSWFPLDEGPERARAVLARAKLVAELVEKLSKARPTRGSPIVTGFSQGGVLSFALAAYHPEKLAAALPIAGALPGEVPPAVPAPGFPVYAFHGEEDARIGYVHGLRTVEWLKKAGRKATMTSYAHIGHSVPPAMRRDLLATLSKLLKPKQK